MSNDQPSRRPPAKSSGGGAPKGSTIAIVIAVVAAVGVFLILRNINNDSDASSGDTGNTSAPPESTGDTSTSSTTPAPSTTAALTTTGATVVVANASGVGGAAGQFTTALQSVGFTLGKPTNAVAPEERVDVSKVYFVAGADAVADSVARAMGAPGTGVTTAPMPATIPVQGAPAGLGDATVLVMLGKDLAGKPLPILAPAGTAESTTTLPGSPLNSSTSSSTG